VAIAIDAGERSRPSRPTWMRQRSTEPTTALTALMLALIMTGVSVAVLVEQSLEFPSPRFTFSSAESHRPIRPVDGTPPVVANSPAVSTDVQPMTVTQPESSVVPTEPGHPPTPTLAVGARARVTNTDGVGVVLHSAPRPGARQPAGLLEGTGVTVLELSGADWVRVQSETRQTGWVPSSFLAPSDE